MDLELRSERNEDGVVALWLDHQKQKVVVLDAWLLDQLQLFLDDFEKTDAEGLVVMSANRRSFIAGADLGEIEQLSDEKLHAYLTEGADAFARIARLPCPTVAAIDSTVLGGGLELAMHCDALIAARRPGDKPYRIGLPEAGLGLCPGWGGTQMLPARIDPAHAIEMAALGEARTLETFPAGLFTKVVENETDLYEAAVRWIDNNPKSRPNETPKCIDETNREGVAAGLRAIRESLPDTPAAHAVIEAVEIGVSEGWAAGLAAERRLLVSLRHTEAAKEKLATFFARNA